jgi:hypothetical protein
MTLHKYIRPCRNLKKGMISMILVVSISTSIYFLSLLLVDYIKPYLLLKISKESGDRSMVYAILCRDIAINKFKENILYDVTWETFGESLYISFTSDPDHRFFSTLSSSFPSNYYPFKCEVQDIESVSAEDYHSMPDFLSTYIALASQNHSDIFKGRLVLIQTYGFDIYSQRHTYLDSYVFINRQGLVSMVFSVKTKD